MDCDDVVQGRYDQRKGLADVPGCLNSACVVRIRTGIPRTRDAFVTAIAIEDADVACRHHRYESTLVYAFVYRECESVTCRMLNIRSHGHGRPGDSEGGRGIARACVMRACAVGQEYCVERSGIQYPYVVV